MIPIGMPVKRHGLVWPKKYKYKVRKLQKVYKPLRWPNKGKHFDCYAKKDISMH